MHRVMSILASVLLAAVLAVGCKSKSEDKGQPTAVVEPAAGETPALAKKGVAPAKDCQGGGGYRADVDFAGDLGRDRGPPHRRQGPVFSTWGRDFSTHRRGTGRPVAAE